jgi:NAD(P)-dependent dehydrogenase (short-subunit alcohol dehydrogenase family)
VEAVLEWRLVGKPVIVTGGSSGIGAATARALGSAGASVILVGRGRSRLDRASATVEEAGGKAHIASAELTDVAAAGGVVDEALSAFGSLHGIVHSASVFDPRPLIAGPEELATGIVFMPSGLSEYVHGATLVVDGGWVAR